MPAMHLFISGQVQGVGFRAFVEREAARNRLSGWVRNLSDGRVEAVFEGESENVDRAIQACRTGPAGSVVSKVDVAEHRGPTADRFRVLASR